jgi:hypothetical protein
LIYSNWSGVGIGLASLSWPPVDALGSEKRQTPFVIIHDHPDDSLAERRLNTFKQSSFVGEVKQAIGCIVEKSRFK